MPGLRYVVQGPLWGALSAAPSSLASIARRSGVNPRSAKFRVRAWAAQGLVEVRPAEPRLWSPRGNGQPGMRSAASARLWAALLVHAPATSAVLSQASGVGRNRVAVLLSDWAAGGFVSRTTGAPVRYALPTNDAPPAERAPRRRTAQERMWSAMRVLRTFDLPTLEIAAEANRKTAREYVSALLRAGFLHRVNECRPAPGEFSAFRLVRRSGLKAPSVRRKHNGKRVHEIFDPNDGSCHPIAPPAAGANCAREVNHDR